MIPFPAHNEYATDRLPPPVERRGRLDFGDWFNTIALYGAEEDSYLAWEAVPFFAKSTPT